MLIIFWGGYLRELVYTHLRASASGDKRHLSNEIPKTFFHRKGNECNQFFYRTRSMMVSPFFPPPILSSLSCLIGFELELVKLKETAAALLCSLRKHFVQKKIALRPNTTTNSKVDWLWQQPAYIRQFIYFFLLRAPLLSVALLSSEK